MIHWIQDHYKFSNPAHKRLLLLLRIQSRIWASLFAPAPTPNRAGRSLWFPPFGRSVSLCPPAPTRQRYTVSIHVHVTVSPCSHQAAQWCFQCNSSVSMQQLQNDPGLQHAGARKHTQNVAAQGRRWSTDQARARQHRVTCHGKTSLQNSPAPNML